MGLRIDETWHQPTFTDQLGASYGIVSPPITVGI
jgi:hypothetical protein